MKAFPQSAKTMYGDENCEWGMDLRDYFAAKAMQSLACEQLGIENEEDWQTEIDRLALMSYSVADAMMEARK
jgi:hypothetical protein